MKRKVLYSSIGIFILTVFLFLIFLAVWTPPPPKEYFAKSDITAFEQLLYFHNEMHGAYPDSLKEIDPVLLDGGSYDYADPWGYEYSYKSFGDSYELYSIGLKQNEKLNSQ